MENENKSIEHPLNLSLRYLSYQARSIFEVEQYMKKKGFDNDQIKKVIDLLQEKNYLNDIDFAQMFIKNRVKYKPKSKYAFRYELKNKGVAPCIIDNILEPYDDIDLAEKSIKPKIRQWKNIDMEKLKKKMMNFLRYRGFSYDVSAMTLNSFLKSSDEMGKNHNEY